MALPFPGRAEIEAMPESSADPPPERDAWILAQCDAGRLDAPRWIRIPVRGGLEVEVMGDVLSFGGVRLCGSMVAAQGVADAWDAMLITPAISDAIWKAATVKLPAPINMDPNPGGGAAWMLYQADRLEAAFAKAVSDMGSAAASLPYVLVADSGKDYVLEHRVLEAKNRDKCAIYGWHKPPSGAVVQSGKTGASYVHGLRFLDYSQTIRLVRRRCWFNGKVADLADIYASQPDIVNHLKGTAPPPPRHPSIPFRKPAGFA